MEVAAGHTGNHRQVWLPQGNYRLAVHRDPLPDRDSVDRRRAATTYRPILALITIAIAGCADPAAEQARRERQADQINLFGDAATYYTCTHKAVQLAGECRRWREAYERDYAAFMAKYGER